MGTVTVGAYHPRYAPKTIQASVNSRLGARQDIELSSGGRIMGIVSVNGEPEPGANLWINADGRNFHESTRTDDEGHYEFDALQDGNYRLGASVQVNGASRNKNVQAEALEGMVTEANIDFLAGTSTLEGIVYESEGRPFPGSENTRLTLQFNGAAGETEHFWTQLASDGSYLFEGLPAGQATLSLYVPGRNQKTIRLTIGDRQSHRQDINLYGGATLNLAVSGILAGPNVYTNALLLTGIHAIDGLSMDMWQRLSPSMTGSAQIIDGVGALTGLEPGSYTLIVISQVSGADPEETLRTAAWGTTTVQLSEDEVRDVALTLR
jgi:hypothetical protein